MQNPTFALTALMALAVSTYAHADQFSGKIFELNEGKTFVGRNPLKNAPCTLGFWGGSMYYHFSKDLGPVDVGNNPLEHYMGSFSAGHFRKAWTSKSIVHNGGGELSLECLMRGHCMRVKTQLYYETQTKFKSLVDSSAARGEDFKTDDRCDF